MIQEIKREDIPICVQVIRESFLTVADAFHFTNENAPRFTAFAVNEDRLYWQYDTERRLMYTYSADKKIVGYYSLILLEEGVCELNNLCVLPAYRHQGIGGELLQSAFAQAKNRNCAMMKIGIVEENKTLRQWYEMQGFHHTGTQKFDFFPFTAGYMERAL